ncbi:MAG: ABC transporter permease [Verrucomicrobia bacterium]|nr:ABC transporter permease [Verrucomicrobiota bacterium]MCH8527235.1 ABC transporter permease [Kiritimatiellia bacterium]
MKPAVKNALKGDVLRLLVLLGIFGLFTLMVPGGRFARAGNVESMLVQSAVVAVAALGATLVIISAGIDLSVGSILALAVVVMARVMESAEGALPPWLALGAALGIGAVCGLINGALITKLGMVPFVVTLATLQIFRGLASGLAGETNIYPRESWLQGMMDPVAGNADRAWMLMPPGVWIAVIGGILMAAMLRYTRAGRHMFAVGSNEETARLCGVPVGRVKLTVYMLAGLFAGLAGVLQYAYIGIGQPTTGQGYELMVIAAVVIGGGSLSGGEGTIAGTLIGALLIGVLFAGCVQMGWPKWIQTVVTGLIIAVAVLLDRMRQQRQDAG